MELSEINRELGEVQVRLDAVKEQVSADAELMRLNIRERHGELRADIQQLIYTTSILLTAANRQRK